MVPREPRDLGLAQTRPSLRPSRHRANLRPSPRALLHPPPLRTGTWSSRSWRRKPPPPMVTTRPWKARERPAWLRLPRRWEKAPTVPRSLATAARGVADGTPSRTAQRAERLHNRSPARGPVVNPPAVKVGEAGGASSLGRAPTARPRIPAAPSRTLSFVVAARPPASVVLPSFPDATKLTSRPGKTAAD